MIRNRPHLFLFILAAFGILFLGLPLFVGADTLGQVQVFNVNSGYDQFGRESLSATLRNVSAQAYFYVEDKYWDDLNSNGKTILTDSIISLAQEFDNNIYPKETQFWGAEPNLGIDNDPKIVVVLQDLISGNGGYFNTGNGFSKKDFPESNERDMFFVSVESLFGNLVKIFLAHEFQHLISFNQKELTRNIQEDIWLNELRSEYSVSLVGYNDSFNNSNLDRRVDAFLDNSSDSLVEWPNVSLDYAHAALFAEYLVEQYSSGILKESLQSLLFGIPSLDEFLRRYNYEERFSSVFENWTIANYLNDISVDSRYGYKRNELKSIHVFPQQTSIFYPSASIFNYTLKPWQPAWYQYNFNSLPQDKAVKIDYNSNYLFKILYTDNLGRVGVLSNPGYITNPGGLTSVVLIPVNESRTTSFGSNETPAPLAINIDFVDNISAQPVIDGSLIKRPRELETYVVEGKYKRYLRPEIIKLYGHLDPLKAIELDNEKFNSYTTANYVRYVNDKKVYAVWPDGTKHWLNMTGDYFTQSGRDWNAIFIINELEFNSYKTGADITK